MVWTLRYNIGGLSLQVYLLPPSGGKNIYSQVKGQCDTIISDQEMKMLISTFKVLLLAVIVPFSPYFL